MNSYPNYPPAINSRYAPYRSSSSQPSAKYGQFWIVVMAVLHPALAWLMQATPIISTVHAYLTILVGVGVAAFGKDARKVAYVAAYIVGAEVLWRMTGAQIFWEGGKYYVVLILGISLLRFRARRELLLPLLFFVLLLASVPITLANLGLTSEARDALSFNLSGALALTVCAWYFLQIKFDQVTIREVVWCVVFPILGIAMLTFIGTVSVDSIIFTKESNFDTSGGFGPNQVSAILGLGGGLLVLLFFTSAKVMSRWLSLGIALGLFALSALTFSRGGLYNVAVMISLSLAHFLQNARGRFVTIIGLFVLSLVGGYVIFPRLNEFTGGMLEERFKDTDTTLRGAIAQMDIEMWLTHPILGLGPGMSKAEHEKIFGLNIAAHTEYTRILAEHGAMGLVAVLIILILILRAYLRAPTIQAQTWTVALAAWPMAEMSHSAMRLVAISFLLGLALVQWVKPQEIYQGRSK